MESYYILGQGGTGQIVERKSKFIATIEPVASEEEAAEFIARMKKKYWDARHNCSAFIVGEETPLTRCSDDGEPSGTAGRPMLEVLTNANVRNVAVVVTRYFGGVLLGTGGLVRAYTKAVQEGLNACELLQTEYGYPVHIETDYTGLNAIQKILREQGLDAERIDYGENVTIDLNIPAEMFAPIEEKIIDATNARAVVEAGDLCTFTRAKNN